MKFTRAVDNWADYICLHVTNWTGSTSALLLSVLFIVLWLAAGPHYNYSDTWQLIANTFTTLVTFVMVFVLQRTQNNHTDDIHNKLNDLIARLDSRSSNDVKS